MFSFLHTKNFSFESPLFIPRFNIQLIQSHFRVTLNFFTPHHVKPILLVYPSFVFIETKKHIVLFMSKLLPSFIDRNNAGSRLRKLLEVIRNSLARSDYLVTMLDGYLNRDKLPSAPAAERNKAPILKVLQRILTSDFSGRALEVSSGTGQHVTFFAKHFPRSTWQPTEFDPSHLGTISAYISEFEATNVSQPFLLDASQPFSQQSEELKPDSFQFLLCCNLIHISPWNVAEGLFNGAGVVLKPNGLMMTYGPYAVDGVLSPESNVRFDATLRSRDSSWGIRDIKDVKVLASQNGLKLEEIVDMPANNKCLLFRKLSTE